MNQQNHLDNQMQKTVKQLLVLQPRNKMDLVAMTFQHLKYVHNTGKQRIK